MSWAGVDTPVQANTTNFDEAAFERFLESLPEDDDTVMTSCATVAPPSDLAQPFRLFDLPPELRIRVYFYATLHSGNDGVIAPRATDQNRSGKPMMLINGEWREVMSIQGAHAQVPVLYPLHHHHYDLTPTQGTGRANHVIAQIGLHFDVMQGESGRFSSIDETDGRNSTNEEGVYYLDEKDYIIKFHRGHICTQACLVPPPITRANRQLREEAGATFYDVNDFRLQLRGVQKARIVKWWRSIGDRDLRGMNYFGLEGDGGESLEVAEKGKKITAQSATERVGLDKGRWAYAKWQKLAKLKKYDDGNEDEDQDEDEEGSVYYDENEEEEAEKRGEWVVCEAKDLKDSVCEVVVRQLWEGKLCVLYIEQGLKALRSKSAIESGEEPDELKWQEYDSVEAASHIEAATKRHAEAFPSW